MLNPSSELTRPDQTGHCVEGVPVAAGEWHHSDFREVSYTFTYKLFREFVEQGDLR